MKVRKKKLTPVNYLTILVRAHKTKRLAIFNLQSTAPHDSNFYLYLSHLNYLR